MIRELQCCFCTHFQGGRNLDGTIKPFVCRAFPFGIPEPILSGEVEHTTLYPGDNGIRFEADEGFDIPSHVAEEIEWTEDDERSANRAMEKLRRELGRGDDVP